MKRSNHEISIKFNRIIGFVSDMHTLSRTGLLPDNSFNEDGKDLALLRNQGQKIIWRGWKKFIDMCNYWKVDTIINGADACAGLNYKEGGRDVMNTNLDVQTDAAIEALAPLVKDRVYHAINGSTYHESRDMKIHRAIAKRLESEHGATKSHFHEFMANIKLIGTNKLLNLAHKASNAMIYPVTALDRESFFMKIATAEQKLPHADYIVRAHLHHYFHYDTPTQHIIQLPCWQGWYPIKGSARLYGRQPDIGGVIMFIDNKNRTTVHHYLLKDFGLPQPHVLDFLKKG